MLLNIMRWTQYNYHKMFTFPQASSIYSYLSSLEKMSELRIV